MSGGTGRIFGMVLGAIAGYFTGGLSYVAIGATVGGAIGGAFDTTKTEGPRLDDLKVQSSQYGVGIPVLYGTERISPNVIWSTDKLEIATTVEGKGGGTENKSYKYYVHMRLLLCETPRDGTEVSVVRLFQDGKLIWDASSGIAIGSALASSENLFAGITIYQGHQDQMPDGREEVWTGGPGTSPAYRGVVTAWLQAIECPGGRVPQFSMVMSNGATVGSEVQPFVTVPPVTDDLYMGAIKSSGVWHYWVENLGFGNGTRIHYYYGESGGEVQSVGQIDLPDHNNYRPYPLGGTASPLLIWPHQLSGSATLDVINLQTRTRTQLYQESGAADCPGYYKGRGAYDDSTERYVVLSLDTGEQPLILDASGVPTAVEPISGTVGLVGITPDMVYVVSYSGGALVLSQRIATTGLSHANFPDVPGPTISTPDFVYSAMHVQGGFVYVYLVYSAGGQSVIYKVTPANTFTVGTWEVLINNPSDTTANVNNDVSRTFFANDDLAIIGPIPTSDDYKFIRFHVVTPGIAKVNDIIEDQCQRAGATSYDVTAIPDSDTVFGYKLANPASARSNIDPLLTAFSIFVVDEDGAIRFKKLDDIVSTATVKFDELGQAQDGAEAGDAMPLSRTQEIDLPRSVTVSYIEPTFDFQIASETEIRQVTDATQDTAIQLPLCISSDQAKRTAQTILYARWRGQNTRSLNVSRKFAANSPGDGVTVEYPRGTFKLWRIMTANDTGARCEWTVEPGDAQLFTQTAIGATDYPSQEVSPLAPQTRMLLLDSPIMRDQDNNAGLYVAAEGYGAGWRGYTLWIGDDDNSLQDRGTVTTPVPLGFAEGALGVWTPNMLDNKNSVILNMGNQDHDLLVSTTEAALRTSRVNLALIGEDGRWEAIQFMTASSLGGGRFLVYDFLRGLFGTERFAGTHQAGDRFVLITPAGMLRPSMDAGAIGSTMSYRPVSLGRSFDSAPSVEFANEAVGLLPYSPWDARKSRAASNDQTITWQRRTRLSSNSLRGIIPLGEASESYSVEFYTSSAFTTLAGTLTSSTKSLTITSAQQTSFGLTPGATLYVHIRQVSDIIGAGTPLEATL